MHVVCHAGSNRKRALRVHACVNWDAYREQPYTLPGKQISFKSNTFHPVHKQVRLPYHDIVASYPCVSLEPGDWVALNNILNRACYRCITAWSPNSCVTFRCMVQTVNESVTYWYPILASLLRTKLWFRINVECMAVSLINISFNLNRIFRTCWKYLHGRCPVFFVQSH